MLRDAGFPIFVFGSNLAGRHGKGAALAAKRFYGAADGLGQGPQGRSYAIATKDEGLATLPLGDISKQVEIFLGYAAENPGKTFLITPFGTGLAGYQDADIAPLMASAPANCILPGRWMTHVGKPVRRMIVAGSRGISDSCFANEILDRCLERLIERDPEIPVEVVSGGARGADTLGEEWAAQRGLNCLRFPADWNRIKRPAGHVRNHVMAIVGTHLVAFWDGVSPGTKSMIDLARKEGVATYVPPKPANVRRVKMS